MENLELEIIANGMDGEGIAKKDGKVFFVEGAIQGDIVNAKIVKENKNFVNAEIDEILQKSPYRCKPSCPYYGECGGCNMQHICYDKTLEIKTQNVQNLLDKQKLYVNVKNCISSDKIFGYRNKLTLYMSKQNSLGFYAKKSNFIVPINKCLLVDDKFNNLINKLNIFLKNNNECNALVIKGISVRQINDNLFIINLILNKKINLGKLENYLKLNKINYGLFYCINTKNNLPVSPCYFAGGSQNINITENNITYPVHPLSFLQVNNVVKTKIYKDILSLVDSNKVVLDTYSGAGLLSSLIAKKSKKVFAVEKEPSASSACKELCKLNNINNLVSICGDCGVEVPKIVKENKIDTIILDPARKGADEKTLNAILEAKPETIIYLSCNPATLARDIKLLVGGGGHKIQSVQPYDMFPNTSEVETLVQLKKIN